MKLKQEAWVLYLRAINTDGTKFDILPFWGRVAELVIDDVLWCEDLRKYICLQKIGREQDMLYIDAFIICNPADDTLKNLDEKILATTKQMFADSNFNAPGKRAEKGFRKNSIIYLTSVPDVIKPMFGFEMRQ